MGSLTRGGAMENRILYRFQSPEEDYGVSDSSYGQPVLVDISTFQSPEEDYGVSDKKSLYRDCRQCVFQSPEEDYGVSDTRLGL